MALALFDLDGTLLADDTQLLFHQFIKRREPLRHVMLPLQTAFMPLALTGTMSSRELKRAFLSFLALMPAERLQAYAEEFVQSVVLPLLFPELKEEIERHRREGRILVLNSASPELWVNEVGKALRFDHVFGTRLVIKPVMPFIPEIDGPNNKCEAKLPPMQAAGLIPCASNDCWAYSDSVVDLPLLELAEYPVLINPNASFTALGESRGWKILRPQRPWAGKWGRVARIAKQIVG